MKHFFHGVYICSQVNESFANFPCGESKRCSNQYFVFMVCSLELCGVFLDFFFHIQFAIDEAFVNISFYYWLKV